MKHLAHWWGRWTWSVLGGRVAVALVMVSLWVAPVHAQDSGSLSEEARERVEQAMAHLGQRLGEPVTRDQNPFTWTAVTWPDASLNCPVGERTYAAAPIPGYQVQITVHDESYVYHLTADGGAMVLCIDGMPDPDSDWGPLGSKINWWGLAAQVEPGARLTVSGWGDNADAEPIRAAITQFQDLFPSIEVEYRPEYSDCDYLEDYYAETKEQMAAGTASDVFIVSPCLMSAFAPYGMLLPLDEYMQAVNLSRDDYAPSLVDMFTYEGKIYAIPVEMDALGLVYLPHLFDAAGVSYPAAGWTWQDMMDAARTISEVTGVYGACVSADAASWVAAVYQAGGTITDAGYTTAHFNSPEAVQALEFWYGMYDDGYAALPAALNVETCADAVGLEMVAMSWEILNSIAYVEAAYPGIEYAVAPLPVGPAGPGNVVFGTGVGVKASTPFPVAAALLALYLTGDESEQRLMESGMGLPTWHALLDAPWFEQHPVEAALLDGARSGRPFYFGHSFFFGLDHRAVRDSIQEALRAVFLGERSIQEALDAAVTNVQ